ncbi:HNH endonuclease [Alicyclobacillus mengziensis]|uniref:HNH endonuclease n=1 Tax=Alicyclobacillus mengziensis TaxID=2931921 RepID=UPI0032048FDA
MLIVSPGPSLTPARHASHLLPTPLYIRQRSGLIQRLLADTCELCESHDNIEVHNIRDLKDLRRKGNREQPEWVKNMAARRRKTLIVCRKCHEDITLDANNRDLE